jgi:hypothetical protein
MFLQIPHIIIHPLDEVQSEEEIDLMLEDGSVNDSDVERTESVVRKRSKGSLFNQKSLK